MRTAVEPPFLVSHPFTREDKEIRTERLRSVALPLLLKDGTVSFYS